MEHGKKTMTRLFVKFIMLHRVICLFTLLTVIIGCDRKPSPEDHALPLRSSTDFTTVGEIEPPAGYERINVTQGSFAHWLRQIKLRKDNEVRLYNGSLKSNQTAQFAVLDLPVGNKDLQQCADVILRLRADYFF